MHLKIFAFYQFTCCILKHKMWQIYDVIIAGEIHDCVSTPTVRVFVYDVIYDLIPKVSINKK